MKRKKSKFTEWLWLIIPAVVLLCGGIYFFLQIEDEQEKGGLVERTSPVETPAPVADKAEQTPERAETGPDLASVDTEAHPPPITHPEETAGTELEENILDFFVFLNKQDYVQQLDPKMDTMDRFQKILKRLVLNPPVPSAEANNPGLMLKNITYLFRTLDPNDLRLTKAVILNEQNSLETDLGMFYQWLTFGGGPPELEPERPSRDVQYQFAGFFLNTIGGRGYLFRRTYKVRLLVTYYCILILHESDEQGKNIYGIDIAPVVQQLNDEMKRYPGFQNYKEYVDQLNRIEKYYAARR